MNVIDNNLKELESDLALACCPVCKSPKLKDDFQYEGFQVQACPVCHLKLLNPQPSNEVLADIYGADYFLTDYSPEAARKVSEMKRATARLYLDTLEQYSGNRGGKLLEVGSGLGDFLVEAQARGYEVTGIEFSSHAVETARARLAGGQGQVFVGEVETANLPENSFDFCVMSDVLEHVRQPERFLKAVHSLLKPGGIIMVTVPSLDSWSAKLLGQKWMEFKTEHLFYFNRANLESLFFLNHFNRVLTRPSYKVLSPGYIFAHFDRYPVPGITPITRLITRVTPRPLLDRPIKLVASGMTTIARKQPETARRKLSVIMPVFNERRTFAEVMGQLVEKEIAGLDIEIIVVESNSTDGTRDEVLKYQNHPRVKLVLEEKPRGKGHAVRTGLSHATGDFLLIQDADLEYDLNDYAELLEPLRRGHSAFVLGSRHGFGGAWKMRHFVDQPSMALMLNGGHIFFTTLLNLLYGQHMKDPFTMFKVIRRDCLFGLKFESNRFDFDFEFVIKLLRKGYHPIEIPVSYNSRSFSEGKKVTMLRDPLTWFRALARFRVQPLNLFRNAREENQKD